MESDPLSEDDFRSKTLVKYENNQINQKNQNLVYVKKGIKCSKCGEQLLGSDPNYCSSCKHLSFHSKGYDLEK